MKLIFIRSGSAILFSEVGEKPVKVGTVVVLGVDTLCGSEPEGSMTVTTLYLDRDYVVDQVFCETRLLVGQQAAAFTAAALPLCRRV